MRKSITDQWRRMIDQVTFRLRLSISPEIFSWSAKSVEHHHKILKSLQLAAFSRFLLASFWIQDFGRPFWSCCFLLVTDTIVERKSGV